MFLANSFTNSWVHPLAITLIRMWYTVGWKRTIKPYRTAYRSPPVTCECLPSQTIQYSSLACVQVIVWRLTLLADTSRLRPEPSQGNARLMPQVMPKPPFPFISVPFITHYSCCHLMAQSLSLWHRQLHDSMSVTRLRRVTADALAQHPLAPHRARNRHKTRPAPPMVRH